MNLRNFIGERKAGRQLGDELRKMAEHTPERFKQLGVPVKLTNRMVAAIELNSWGEKRDGFLKTTSPNIPDPGVLPEDMIIVEKEYWSDAQTVPSKKEGRPLDAQTVSDWKNRSFCKSTCSR